MIVNQRLSLTAGKVWLAAHYIEENVEAIRIGRVSRNKEYKCDRVDRARLGHDRSFPRKTEGLARVTQSGLARPQAIGDEHYSTCEKWRGVGGLSEVSMGEALVKEKQYERVQSPFTATVELRNALVILSCFWMKTLSPLVRPDRP